MNNIKIFVSHRIDINSEIVENSIYIPVRCGAIFDKENPMNILGDDTGENISEKRMSFCEFTVQYWAWKNIDADYYGLCHYRRYLCFSQQKFKTDKYNMIHVPVLTPHSKEIYNLLNKDEMEKLILPYDIITSEYANVSNIPTPLGKMKSVYEMWESYDNIFFEKSILLTLLKLIDKLSPEYSDSAREYLNGEYHRGFNCYILKKNLFYRLCEFQFPIMFEIEKCIDATDYNQTMKRTPAFMGEILYGIFMYHLIEKEKFNTSKRQLIFFSDTDRIKDRFDLFKRLIWFKFDRITRFLIDPIMPNGSKRREFIKNVFYKMYSGKRRGIANIKEGEV